ncbi:uncharacterized protein LTR77_001942 [Saxophila tyrrhenica]|uniref:C2H2-type domain-containing protein n=1 Tax=Saxophila tyrrhenica TaxID=1690608 RepID=A0AAV9PLP1_9PEZI|nr:hypothetical protein LTR77_001942 [Saxophila tyrrhenica]
MDDEDHWPECETCPKLFATWNSCYQHRNATGRWAPKHECHTCSKKFHSAEKAASHMARNDHYSSRYCIDCKTFFQNENNLKQHRNSKLHRGSNNITCPFCKNGFMCASGLAHHLETGSCRNAPSLNREKLFRVVCQADPTGFFTNMNVQFGKSNARWEVNDAVYDYYRRARPCHLCSQGFATANGLSQHLNSPKHQQKVYHCPKTSCGKKFAALAGLANHLESESCGLMRYEAVQKKFGRIMDSSRMLGYG